ncbi:MAG TPA: hypothetical protein VID20_02440 [Sphingomicrobium sp.]
MLSDDPNRKLLETQRPNEVQTCCATLSPAYDRLAFQALDSHQDLVVGFDEGGRDLDASLRDILQFDSECAFSDDELCRALHLEARRPVELSLDKRPCEIRKDLRDVEGFVELNPNVLILAPDQGSFDDHVRTKLHCNWKSLGKAGVDSPSHSIWREIAYEAKASELISFDEDWPEDRSCPIARTTLIQLRFPAAKLDSAIQFRPPSCLARL